MLIGEYGAMPVVVLRGIVILPTENITIDITSPKGVAACNYACNNNNGSIVFVYQEGIATASPDIESLPNVGTLCSITQAVRVPGDNTLRLIVKAGKRVIVNGYKDNEDFITADVAYYTDAVDSDDNTKCEALRRRIAALAVQYAKLRPQANSLVERLKMTESVRSDGLYADKVAALLLTDAKKRYDILSEVVIEDRLTMLHNILSYEVEVAEIDKSIETQVSAAMTKAQKEYYLREKIRVIKDELGDTDESVAEEFRARLAKKQVPPDVFERLTREINRLSALPQYSQEAPSLRNFIECMLDLPWLECSTDNIDVKRAKDILDRDHYGLVKVKQRILEYLAVSKLTGNLSGQIICLVGPPGVGKTSIASAIAESVGRNFVRMSLGGIDDEAEIRGHRRTYLGAMPGRIIAAMRQAKTNNPVVLFDEIDKLNKNFHGDPAAAMLEVLDPAQNVAFRDHYLEVPYDLSRVMFVTTANSLDTIPRPLLDRMEIIEVPGYLEFEKIKIAQKHLLPKQQKKHGLAKGQLTIPNEILSELIDGYTHESGVRELERKLAAVCRKAACDICNGKTRIRMSKSKLNEYLGAVMYTHDEIAALPEVGSCNGLAWTVCGGETLTVEALIMPGNGTLTLTGSLGDVMKESATAALTYIRAHADDFGLSKELFTDYNIHMHVPEGATPKDGPSAGITIATAMLSALTGRPVRNDVAMTGEITLHGRVLKIGGLREKLLAAVRAGVKTVIVPAENRADIAEIETDITSAVKLIYAEHVTQVFPVALMTCASEIVDSNVCEYNVPDKRQPVFSSMQS